MVLRAVFAWFGETDDVLHEIANLRDPAWGVRRAAVMNLGQMGDRRAVPPLLAALNDMDPQLQNFAVRSLAKLKDPRAIEPLIVLANKSANKQVADVAIQALGEFKDARGVAALIDILNRSAQDDATVASALEDWRPGRSATSGCAEDRNGRYIVDESYLDASGLGHGKGGIIPKKFGPAKPGKLHICVWDGAPLCGG